MLNLSPNFYWDIFLSTVGFYYLAISIFILPLSYFVLVRPLDRRFKKIEAGFFEEGLFFFSSGFRVVSFSVNIVLQPYRHKKVKNRLIARYLHGTFQHQEQIYGKVDFRKDASWLQIILASMIVCGMPFLPIYAALFIFHDFVLFEEFARARGGG